MEVKVIVNMVVKVFKKQICLMMNVNNVMIVLEVMMLISQFFLNKKFFVLVGLVFGFLISYVYVLICDLIDMMVCDNDFMINELGLINLG